MKAANVVDAATKSGVIVFGSLPPGGRDLDLLVPASERETVESALEVAGFTCRGEKWVWFGDCAAEAVDLVPVEEWDLDAPAAGELFSEAQSIDGYSNLVRPAPHHVLLILARRAARSGGELDEKRRERVRVALAEDPDGWAHAQGAADGWGSYRAVIALERLYRSGVPTSRRKRAAALAERNRHAGRGGYLAAWRTVLRRRRGKGVVTFSGLDGSGKTSQAEALKDALERTTGPTVVVWTRLSYNPSLRALARPVKAFLSAGRGGRPEPSQANPAPDRGKELRSRSAVITQLWATAVALANANAQRRVTRYHLRRGRTVICDRYTLDSRVHLRYRYGEHRRFRLQSWLIKTLSPTPVRSYLVDVPPEVARERKAEQYDLDQLATQSRLYEEEMRDVGVKLLDGTRPKGDLCAEVGYDVWSTLT